MTPEVILAGDETCAGTYIVLDEMNKRFRRSDDQCVINQSSGLCIRGDLAYPLGEKGMGGVCFIDSIIKA